MLPTPPYCNEPTNFDSRLLAARIHSQQTATVGAVCTLARPIFRRSVEAYRQAVKRDLYTSRPVRRSEGPMTADTVGRQGGVTDDVE